MATGLSLPTNQKSSQKPPSYPAGISVCSASVLNRANSARDPIRARITHSGTRSGAQALKKLPGDFLLEGGDIGVNETLPVSCGEDSEAQAIGRKEAGYALEERDKLVLFAEAQYAFVIAEDRIFGGAKLQTLRFA